MDNIFLYTGISIVSLCWVITPFLKRHLGKNLTSIDIFINTQLIMILYGIITLVILRCCKYEFEIFSIKKLDKNQIIILFLASLTTYLSSITLIWLLKNYEVTQIIPQIQPIVMIITIFAGVFIFNEKITGVELGGLSLIISGIYIINNLNKSNN